MSIRRRKKSHPKNHREMSDKRRESRETVDTTLEDSGLLSRIILSRRYALMGFLLIILAAGIAVLVVFIGTDDDDRLSPDNTNPTPSSPTGTPGASETTPVPTTTSRYTQRGTYRVHAQYPHDPKAFCQGLEVKNDTHLYESVGNYGVSAMRIVEISTGQVSLETAMDAELFGEGVTLVTPDNEPPFLIQLTWREKTAITYDPETLVETGRFLYETTNTQGWGIAYNIQQPGNNIVYVTDGTEFVHTWVLEQGTGGEWSYQEMTKIPVTFHLEGRSEEPVALNRINELEYDGHTGTLLANVWFQDVLVRMNVETGFVTKVYDFTNLYKDRAPGSDVFNGIAAIPDRPGHYYITGKWWPVLFHIELIE